MKDGYQGPKPFEKVGRGIFGLRTGYDTTGELATEEPDAEEDDDVIDEAPIIRAFGMYWNRDLVIGPVVHAYWGDNQVRQRKRTLLIFLTK